MLCFTDRSNATPSIYSPREKLLLIHRPQKHILWLGYNPVERQSSIDRIIADATAIYERDYKEKYESKHQGKFVAIDIRGRRAYLGKFPEDALQEAREAAPFGVFHLIRVGFKGAFRIRHATERSTLSYW